MGGGVLRFPRGHVFSPSPVLLQLVHSLKTRHHPSPPFLLPSCLLAPQLEVHLLCLISPLAIGYVYHQCTIFVAEVCMPHLGKAYQFQMGLSQKGIHGFGSLSSHCHWDRTLESNYSANWHLLIPLSAKSQHPLTPVFFFFLPLRKALPKRSEEQKTCLRFDSEPQFQHHIKLYARSKNINLIILRPDSWPQAGGRNANTEGEYQMWSLWLGHSSPKHRPGRSIERRTMMVWCRATADDENSGQSVI